MKKLWTLFVVLALFAAPSLQAQKGKNKGNDKGKVNVKIKNDDVKIKVKSNGGNDKVKIDIKSKGNDGFNGKGDHNFDGHHDNGWHNGNNRREYFYGGNNIIWFFGPGDIYGCRGKNKKQRIVLFDDVCVRLTANIGFMFGFLGDIRINLDAKKAKMKPERYKKIKIEIDLLDEELKLIEIKKKKIKLRLGVLAKED